MNQFYEVSYNHEVKDIRKIFKEKNDKVKIFCPECQEAKLFIRGKGKNKFIIDQPTSPHIEGCSYSYRPLNFKEAKKVFNETSYHVDQLMNEVYAKRQNKNAVGNVIIDYNMKTKTVKKRMPLINIEDIDDEMLNNANIFFGIADIELIKSKRGYIIKLSAPKSQFQYLVINVSENTYKHLDENFKKNKIIKNVNFMYYGVVTVDSKKWKVSNLVNTKYLIFK